MDIYCEIGNRYIEYIKFACVIKQGTACQFCKEIFWIVQQCSGVPRSFPHYGKLPYISSSNSSFS